MGRKPKEKTDNGNKALEGNYTTAPDGVHTPSADAMQPEYVVLIANEDSGVVDAEYLANNEAELVKFETLVKEARAIITERNKPKPLSVEEMEGINYQRLVDRYGKDFVTAKKGNQQTYFTRKSWIALGANRNGWVEVTPEHPELKK
jgi:hypothetical protein